MAPLKLGWVRLTSDDPHYTFTCRMGDAPPILQGGLGGWVVISRPRRVGLTEWQGIEPLRLVLALLMDHWRSQLSVEPDIHALEQMGRVGENADEPPIITLEGAVPQAHLPWVVESIVWGDADRNPDGDRVRCASTVTLLRHIADDRVATSSPAKKHRAANTPHKGASHGAPTKRYTVKTGDTLTSIAARQLGASKRWREIAALNDDIRDPKMIRAGQTLLLP